jgi:hypothetical protein
MYAKMKSGLIWSILLFISAFLNFSCLSDLSEPDSTEEPLIKELHITETDTLNQVVRVSWVPIDSTLIRGYNIYVSINGANFERLTSQPLNPGATSISTTASQAGATYEFRVVIVELSGKEGAWIDQIGDEIVIASSDLVSTTIAMAIYLAPKDSVSINDTVIIKAEYSNPTQLLRKIEWTIDSSIAIVRSRVDSSLSGIDTLVWAWPDSGRHYPYITVTDDAGGTWRQRIGLDVVLDRPIATPISAVGQNGDTVILRGNGADEFSKKLIYEWDLNGTGIYCNSSSADTSIIVPSDTEVLKRITYRVRDDDELVSDTVAISIVPFKIDIFSHLPKDCMLAAFVFNEKIWVMYQNDIAYYGDGSSTASWTAVAMQNHFPGGNPVVFNDKIWTIARDSLWCSIDGLTYTLVADSVPIGWGPVVHNNKMFVLGISTNLSNSVWSSENGADWQLLTGNAAIPNNLNNCISFKGNLFAFAEGYCFESDDGVSWNGNGEFCTPRASYKVLIADDAMWIYGGYREISGPDYTFCEIFRSNDGKIWSTMDRSSYRHSYLGVTFNQDIWYLGGKYSGGPQGGPNTASGDVVRMKVKE